MVQLIDHQAPDPNLDLPLMPTSANIAQTFFTFQRLAFMDSMLDLPTTGGPQSLIVHSASDTPHKACEH